MRAHPLPSEFFSENRNTLASRLPESSLALVQSAEWMVRNGDNRFPWRQNSSFFYLTGIEQPGCSLLLIPKNSGQAEEILFIPPVDPELEKWEGEMLTEAKATEISGIKTIRFSDNLLPSLYRAQKWRENLFCDINDLFTDQPLTKQHLLLQELGLRIPGLSLRKLEPHIAVQRTVKKPVEIDRLRQSISIIDATIRTVMKKIRPNMKEYEIEAEVAYQYISRGCSRLGFETIVAGGKNATILHYVKNDDILRDGDLLLLDTGGEYGMYSGDITRVIPVNGRFSTRQKECYQTVLDIQKAVIDEIQPGMTYQELYKISGQIQGDILASRGFIDRPEEHNKVTLHRIGHYLGLDVHDVGSIEWKLNPGVVITIEPGLYLREEGIGIRIEDNLLITENGVEILSSSIPKEIEEIEEICRSGA